MCVFVFAKRPKLECVLSVRAELINIAKQFVIKLVITCIFCNEKERASVEANRMETARPKRDLLDH